MFYTNLCNFWISLVPKVGSGHETTSGSNVYLPQRMRISHASCFHVGAKTGPAGCDMRRLVRYN